MRARSSSGIAFAHPLFFWGGFAACVAGVLLHLPMYLHGKDMHYHLNGMPMDTPMMIGMALIVLGLVAVGYGLVPRDFLKKAPPAELRVRAAGDAKLRPAHIALIAILTAAVTIDAMKPISLGFTAPGVAKEYGLKSALNPHGDLPVALLPFFGLSGTAVGSFVWGWLGDRIGRRAAILFAGVLFVTTATCGAMPSFGWNLAMCFLMGAGAGGMLPITFSLLAETIPGRHRGWLMVLIGGTLALAYVVTSWLSSELVPTYSWRILWLLGMPTGVVLILLNHWIPESPRFLLSHGREEEARAVMARYGASLVEATEPEPEPEAGADGHGGFGRLFRPPFTGLTSAVVVLGLGIGLVTYGFQLWIPSNLQKLGLPQATADRALRDSALLGLPLVFLASALYGLWSAKKTIILFTALVAAALGVLTFAGDDLAKHRDWLYVLLAGPIVGTSVIASVLAAYSSEIYPTRIRSRGSGLSAGVGKLGGVLVTILLVSGIAAPSIGLTALLGVVPLVLAVIAVAVFGVETRTSAPKVVPAVATAET